MKIKVAVIDSGIKVKDKFWDGKRIDKLMICNGKIESCKDSLNTHGNDVAKIIYSECGNIELISIQVLNDENRGSVNDLIFSIQLCICFGVNVINLSLGTVNQGRDILRLNEVCELAAHRNIHIFASNTNQMRSFSYPALFKSVIGIGCDEKLTDFCTVDVNNRNIYLKRDYVSIPNENEIRIKKGTSFICPKFVGFYCELLSQGIVKNIFEFLEFVDSICNKNVFDKIYVDVSKDLKKDFKNKKIVFIKGGNNDDDIISYCKRNCKNITVTTLNELGFDIYYDLYFVGTLSPEKVKNNIFSSIISTGIKHNKKILSIIPLESMASRVGLVNRYDIEIKSFYI